MSRIGRLPIVLPRGVEAHVDGQIVTVKGPRGELRREFDPQIKVAVQEGKIVVTRSRDDDLAQALHGLSRALLASMVEGVSSGFRKTLEIVGVGYRAELQGKDLILQVGHSHSTRYATPEGITLSVDKGNHIIYVDGFDKQLVGQVAAQIRAVRPPEPYLGKGIRYVDEVVRRKAGKAGKAALGQGAV